MATADMDDELDDDKKKKKPLTAEDAAEPIGTPLAPAQGQVSSSNVIPGVDSSQSMSTPPPAVGDAQSLPKMDSIGTPLAPATAPSGLGSSDYTGAVNKLNTLEANPPKYHGIGRVLDTIAGSTNIGSAIERAGDLGTQGHEQDLARARRGVQDVTGQVNEGNTVAGAEAEGNLRNAQAQEATQRGNAAEAAADSVIITLNGVQYTVPRKDAHSLITGQIAADSRNQVADTRADAQRDVAGSKALSLDQLASRAMQNGDQDTVNKIQQFKAKIAAAGHQEPGNFIPINDGQGNTTGWFDPKSGRSVAAGAATSALGGSNVIPMKPNAAQANSAKSANDALNYATQYMSGGKFTGPGDEGLLEQYFEMMKPSSGFRMSQPQIDMLMNARSWMDSAEGKAYHATTGTWFAPKQRQDIVDTMQLRQSSRGGNTPPSAGGSGAPARPNGVPPDATWDAATRTWRKG